jgi:periplasmic protein TonB
MFASRIALSIPQALLITFGLFYFMQALIDTGEFVEQRSSVIAIVDATIPPPELELIKDIDKPEPIDVVTEEVVTPTKKIDLNSGPSLYQDTITPEMDSTVLIEVSRVSATDGDYIPLVNVVPTYPSRALQREIEGWCLVEFTVDGRGNVIEDSIVVVDAEPANTFNRASIRAAARFKFQPRVVDGQGVEVSNVPYIFRFQLDN